MVQIKPKKTKQLKRKAGYSIVNPAVKRYAGASPWHRQYHLVLVLGSLL